VGAALAKGLGWAFLDADDLHPAASVAKLRAGVPLTDADREPWLVSVGSAALLSAASSAGVVVACSALRRHYRDILLSETPDAIFVQLEAPPAVVAQRLDQRDDHFMPPDLLASQLAVLEPLEPHEAGSAFGTGEPPESVVEAIVTTFTERGWLQPGRGQQPA
jgi:carbohydrate kinase (thermoresistant glucokinase family)